VGKDSFSTYMGARMRFVRVAAAATALLLLGAVTSIGSAGAASTGVGTSNASTTVLHVALGNAGSLLDVKLLADSAQSTIDSKTAAVSTAFSKLTALRASSSVLPLDLTVGEKEARQPGGAAVVNGDAIDLANPTGVAGVPAALPSITSGTLSPAKLTSTVDAAGAASSLDASLVDLGVAGGLLSADAVSSKLSSASTSGVSNATRAVKVDAITVLDLGSLLDGLDILLTDLTPSQVSDLLETLGVEIPGVDPSTTLQDTIDDIQSQLAALDEALNTGIGLVDGTAGDIVDAIPGLGDIVGDTTIGGITGTPTEQTNALIDTLQAAAAELLQTALAALDAAPLLQLNGVDVSVTTKAGDTLANSAAEVTAKIGSVTVGDNVIPGIDLLQTTTTINSTIADIEGQIDEVLQKVEVPLIGGTADQLVSLSDLVSITVGAPNRKLETVDGYNKATASISALSATITPPANLADIVAGVKLQASQDQDIVSAIAAFDPTAAAEVSDAMSTLEAALGTGVQALQGGGGVTVVDVLANSEFKAALATTTTTGGPTLPATGSNSLRLAALGLLLVALGLGLGAWFNMPLPGLVRLGDRRPWIRRPI
jgi:hypothetical protein